MKKILSLLIIPVLLYGCSNAADEQKKKDEAAAMPAEAAKPADAKPMAAAEIGDPKYIAIGKAGLEAMHNHDVNSFTDKYADNVVYIWNNGDSLVGKAAVVKYWNDRFATVLDSLSFSNQIWLPVKVNQPQSIEAPGTWLMTWYMVSAKYKNGKSMHQWIHNTMHFNADDKVDRVLQFRDQAPIMAAMKK
jgi:ketosteroid isomerase-like protein